MWASGFSLHGRLGRRGALVHEHTAGLPLPESRPLATPSSTWWQLLAASCLANLGSLEPAACTPPAVFKVGDTQEASPREASLLQGAWSVGHP